MYLTECPFFAFVNFEILPLETLPPPENRTGEWFVSGLFYFQRKHLKLWVIHNRNIFMGMSCYHFAQTPSWRTTPRWLSAAAYLIYLQLPSISETVPPYATWERTMPWWQRPTFIRLPYTLEIFLVLISVRGWVCTESLNIYRLFVIIFILFINTPNWFLT
jgi:hypothetical protein